MSARPRDDKLAALKSYRELRDFALCVGEMEQGSQMQHIGSVTCGAGTIGDCSLNRSF